MKPKQDKYKKKKKNTPKHTIVKLLKTKDKKKILRSVRGKWHTTYRLTDSNDCGLPAQSCEGWKRVEQCKVLERGKNPVKPAIYV